MQLHRREFIQTAVGTLSLFAHTAIRAEEKPNTDNIIDTHTHFYDPTRKEGVPWPGKDDKVLYRKVLPAEFKTLTKDHKVGGTVIVEASPWLEDNQWLLDLAGDDPFVRGIVGHLQPGKDGFPEHLKRFAKNPKYRGIRIGQGALNSGLDDKAFLGDLKRLIDNDLELDINGAPGVLPLIAKLHTQLPDLRIAVNHCANVKSDGNAPPREWTAGMRDCARGKNVFCKVSALVEGTGKKLDEIPKDPEFYQPTINVAWDTFGEDRLIYGSNWPVSARYADYGVVLSIVAAYFGGKGKSATEKFFHRNALTCYKWPTK